MVRLPKEQPLGLAEETRNYSPSNRIPLPPRRFGDGADFYRRANGLAASVINTRAAALNGTLDTLLIFAGLFSAVNSALVAISLPGFSPASSASTDQLLRQLITRNQTVPTTDLFVPPPNVRRDNILFAASLLFSIFAAFGAVLGKQWLVSWTWIPLGSDESQEARELQARIQSAENWRMQFLLEIILPSSLQISLALFIAGLVDFLWAADDVLGRFSCVLCVLGSVGFFATTTAATLYADCPFKTPLSIGLAWLIKKGRTCFRASESKCNGREGRRSDRQPMSSFELDRLASQSVIFTLKTTNDTALVSAAIHNIPAIRSKVGLSDISSEIAGMLVSRSAENSVTLRGCTNLNAMPESLLSCAMAIRALLHVWIAQDFYASSVCRWSQTLWTELPHIILEASLKGTELANFVAIAFGDASHLGSTEMVSPPVYLAAAVKMLIERRRSPKELKDLAVVLRVLITHHLSGHLPVHFPLVAFALRVLRSEHKDDELLSVYEGKNVHQPTRNGTRHALEEELWDIYVGQGNGRVDATTVIETLDMYGDAINNLLGQPCLMWQRILEAVVVLAPDVMKDPRHAALIASSSADILRQLHGQTKQGLHDTDLSVTATLRGLQRQAEAVIKLGIRNWNPSLHLQDSLDGLAWLEDNFESIIHHESSIDASSELFAFAAVVALLPVLPPSQNYNEEEGLNLHPQVSTLLVTAMKSVYCPGGPEALWTLARKAKAWFGNVRGDSLPNLPDGQSHFLVQGMAMGIVTMICWLLAVDHEEFPKIFEADIRPLTLTLCKWDPWIESFSLALDPDSINHPLRTVGAKLQGAEVAMEDYATGMGELGRRSLVISIQLMLWICFETQNQDDGVDSEPNSLQPASTPLKDAWFGEQSVKNFIWLAHPQNSGPLEPEYIEYLETYLVILRSLDQGRRVMETELLNRAMEDRRYPSRTKMLTRNGGAAR